MATTSRIHCPGVPLHVIQRGHNRESCFFDDEDRRAYLGWLSDGLARCEADLHAYVLMTNHVHLLLTPRKPEAVSQLVMSSSRRYVQYVNRRYRRSGTLWNGRYRSLAIEDERYLFECHRYIELNPVRAGIVVDPADYAWSSYRSNALGESDSLLTPREEYLALALTAAARREAYRDLIAEAMDAKVLADIRAAIGHNRPLRPPEPLPLPPR